MYASFSLFWPVPPQVKVDSLKMDDFDLATEEDILCGQLNDLHTDYRRRETIGLVQFLNGK